MAAKVSGGKWIAGMLSSPESDVHNGALQGRPNGKDEAASCQLGEKKCHLLLQVAKIKSPVL